MHLIVKLLQIYEKLLKIYDRRRREHGQSTAIAVYAIRCGNLISRKVTHCRARANFSIVVHATGDVFGRSMRFCPIAEVEEMLIEGERKREKGGGRRGEQ